MSCVALPANQPIRATFRGVDIVATAPPGDGLQLLVALKLLERLLPCPRKATWEQWSSAVDLAVRGAFRACDLYPVAADDLTPESIRYLVGDERIGLLTRCLQRGTPPPNSSNGLRMTSCLVRAISGIVDRRLPLEEAVAVEGRGKLR